MIKKEILKKTSQKRRVEMIIDQLLEELERTDYNEAITIVKEFNRKFDIQKLRRITKN